MIAAARQPVDGAAEKKATTGAKAAMSLRVRSVTWETDDILRFELVAPDGRDLPRFTAGAHIDVHVPTYLGVDVVPGEPGAVVRGNLRL